MTAAPVIHLDTSFLIRSLVPDSNADRLIRGWLVQGHPFAMISVAWAEFLCGPLDADDVAVAAQVVTERIAFDVLDAELAARLFNETGRRRGSLVDCMIAASAIGRESPLATLNLDDFRRFESQGLRLVI